MNLMEVSRRIKELNGWALDGGNCIVKEYEFKDFKENIWFINKVAELAERMNHHPSMLADYNKLRLTLTTHSAGILTEKDFELAKEIDKISL